MKIYNVHLYREMRIAFAGIEADTPEAAAAIARQRPTGDADDIEDCDGQDLGALVDVAGDEEYEHSVTIDFEIERQRKAAPKLLTALQNCASLLADYDEDPGEQGEAYRNAMAAIAAAEEAGVIPAAEKPARFDFTHEPQENPDRAWVMVDGQLDLTITRTGEGIVIDVYPKDWMDPIDTLTVWDDDVAELQPGIDETDAAEEA